MYSTYKRYIKLKRTVIFFILINLCQCNFWQSKNINCSYNGAHRNSQIINQDLKNTCFFPYIGPDKPKIKWSVKLGGKIIGKATIGKNGNIYVGTRDKKLCTISNTGNLKNTIELKNSVTSEPVIDSKGNIYIHNRTHVYSLSSGGLIKWIYNTNGSSSSSVKLYQDSIIYISTDYKLIKLTAGGKLIWERVLDGEIGWSTPAIDDQGVVYVGTYSNKLYAINSNGTVKWTFSTNKIINSPPAIGTDNTIYFGSFDSYFYAINEEGNLKWKRKILNSDNFQLAIWEDKLIYVNTYCFFNLNKKQIEGGILFCFSVDGELNWSKRIYGGDQPAIDINGIVYVKKRGGKIIAFFPNGRKKWVYDIKTVNGIFGLSSPPILGSDGTIYIGSKDGRLFAIGE